MSVLVRVCQEAALGPVRSINNSIFIYTRILMMHLTGLKAVKFTNSSLGTVSLLGYKLLELFPSMYCNIVVLRFFYISLVPE